MEPRGLRSLPSIAIETKLRQRRLVFPAARALETRRPTSATDGCGPAASCPCRIFIPLPARIASSDLSPRSESFEYDRTLFNVVADTTIDDRLRVVIEKFDQE